MNLATSSALTILTSELRSSNLFRNANVPIESGDNLAPKLVATLRDRKKEGPIVHNQLPTIW